MAAPWPTGLPSPFAAGDPVYTPRENVIRTSTEVGQPKVRRRFTGRNEVLKFTLELSAEQRTTFWNFHDVLVSEVEHFDWIDLRTNQAQKYRFTKRPQETYIAGAAGSNWWKLDVELETVYTTEGGAGVGGGGLGLCTLSVNTSVTPATFSGLAPQASVDVDIYVDGTLDQTVTANSSGIFSGTVTLATGQHTIRAIAHITTPPTDVVVLRVEAPPPPPSVGSPTGPLTTAESMLSFSGAVDSAATEVQLLRDDYVIASVAVRNQTTWTISNVALGPDGVGSQFTAVAANTGGESAPSSPIEITIDRGVSPPPIPVISSPTTGSNTNQQTVTFSGTCAATATMVYLRRNGSVIASATVNNQTSWTIADVTIGADGVGVSFTATAYNRGGESTPSTPVLLNIDRVAPSIPVVSEPFSDDYVTSPAIIAGTCDSPLAHTGVNLTIRLVFDGGSPVDIQATGMTWTTTHSFSPGAHTIVVSALDACGNQSGTVSVGFNVAATAQTTDTPTIVSAPTSTINPFTLSGTSEANAIVRVLVDGVRSFSATADGSGNWSISTVTAVLGQRSITVTAQAPGELESLQSTARQVTVVIPDAPVITSPEDSSSQMPGVLTVTGTAQAGTRIGVSVGGGAESITTTSQAGAWTTTVNIVLGAGQVITAVARDVLGQGTNSDTVTVTGAIQPPAAPTVTFPLNGYLTSATSLVFLGTCDSGVTQITIRREGSIVATGVPNGINWSVNVPLGLNGIDVDFVVTATNSAGDSPSTTVTISIVVYTSLQLISPVELTDVNSFPIQISGIAYPPGSTVTLFRDDGTPWITNLASDPITGSISYEIAGT